MEPKNSYKEELQELYDNHTGKALEAALGLTVRSIQNYLKGRVPGKDTINRIHETFANYRAGKGLTKSEVKTDDVNLITARNYENLINQQGKLIALLEKAEGRNFEVDKAISEVRNDILMIASVQEGYQKYWADHYPPKGVHPEEVKKTIHKISIASYRRMKKEGIGL